MKKLEQKENLNDVPSVKIPVKISTSEKFSVQRNVSIPINHQNEESKEEERKNKPEEIVNSVDANNEDYDGESENQISPRLRMGYN